MHNMPWLKYYGPVPATIDYPKITLYEALMRSVRKNPKAVAYDFFGYTATYEQFGKEIDRCADALAALGLAKGDSVTVAMPTSPQGIICFYAVNKLGGVASMIHPLSTPKEIEFYLIAGKSKLALTLDAFYAKFREAMKQAPLEHLLLAKIPDYLPLLKGLGFTLTKGRKIPKVPPDPKVRWWGELMKTAHPAAPRVVMDTHDPAVILYSGGTTGKPKGIKLSNHNFISHGHMVSHWAGLNDSDSVLAILPIFHGFGLGVCVNGVLMGGGKTILVPTFTPEDVAKLIRKKKPSFIIGVPTLYEALTRNPLFRKTRLSCLKAAFSGADSLPRAVKEQFEELVKKQGGKVKLLEGYGLTEAVTGIIATPLNEYRERSIGIPFPDMRAKIVKPGATVEAPVGEEGELCVSGPAVMLGYLDQPDETATVLKEHPDGRRWLHTGDICTMDADGFFYFKLRQKRMIKSSGMNVYPSQVEEHLSRHPAVAEACVIGVPDREQGERVKAFVVLKGPCACREEMQKELIDHCRRELIKWSCPRDIEFRAELPRTLIGKTAWKALQDGEVAKLRAQGDYAGEQ